MAKSAVKASIDIDLPKLLKATRRGAVVPLRLARPQNRNTHDDATVLVLKTFFTRMTGDLRAVPLAPVLYLTRG